MKKCMMFAAALSVASVVLAESKTKVVDGVTYTYDGGTILKVEGDAKTINVPAELDDGVSVTEIGGNALQNNSTVMKIVLPTTVVRISSYAFCGCIALVGCDLPDGLVYIDKNAFDGCVSLRAVRFGNALRHVGDSAFYECLSLSSLTFSDGVEYIGSRAFERTALVHVEMPNSVTVLGAGAFEGCSQLKGVKLSDKLTVISADLFWGCGCLEDVRIHDGVTSIGANAFFGCGALKELIVPASVRVIEKNGNGTFKWIGRVVFLGKPPTGIALAEASEIACPKEFGALWRAQISIDKIGGYSDSGKPVVTIVSTKVREDDPTILDVVYKVTSKKPTVKVRALAFEDGERSFAKVTRPETFIEGTAANVGDAVSANEEHTLSWKVSADFQTDLAKMKFEVLAVEDDILPFEFITIPANGDNKAMQLSWNLLTARQIFDALLWLYADKTEGLTLTNGVLRNDATPLANGSNISYDNSERYVFSMMGFSMLSGDKLTYANEMTRLGLNPSGIRQYAWRWVEP